MSKFFRTIAPAVALGGVAVAVVAILDPALAHQGDDASALASGAQPLTEQPPSTGQTAPLSDQQGTVQGPAVEQAAPAVTPEATSAPKVKKKKKKAASSSNSDSSSSTSSSNTDTSAAQAPAVEPAPNAAGNQGSSASSSCDSAKEITGSSAMTPWGPVQVVASVANGKICSAHAIAYPNRDRKSAMINSYAIPYLDQAASAQGVQFDGVSGATYTTNAYRKSLQSVLDR